MQREFEAVVACGDFEHGFLLARCQWCGEALRVPFSCKSRGICPSCMGRRMAESAALWVDHRMPAVPWRQWVLTFEGPMATRLGYDAELLRFLCRRLATRVMQALRHRVKCQYGLRSSRDLHAGVLVVVQRFRSDLGLFTHLHALVTDGCFAHHGDDDVPFLPPRTLEPRDLTGVLDRVHRDLARRELEEDLDVDPALAACVARSRNGPQVPVPRDDEGPERPLLAAAHGMQLHAAVTIDGRDRRSCAIAKIKPVARRL